MRNPEYGCFAVTLGLAFLAFLLWSGLLTVTTDSAAYTVYGNTILFGVLFNWMLLRALINEVTSFSRAAVR